MALSRFECPRCAANVVVDGAMQSITCPRCELWFHAGGCVHCGAPYIAIGDVAQVCPSCGTHQHLDDGSVRTFADVAEPLFASMSRISLRPIAPMAPLRLTARYERRHNHYPATLATVLNIAALVTFVGGVWTAVEVAHVLTGDHVSGGRVALGILEVLLTTIVAVALLAGLAFLIEHVDAVEGSIEALRRDPARDRSEVD